MITVNQKAVYPTPIPKYETNAQAIAAGLAVGSLFHNDAGQVFIVMEIK